MKRVCVIRASLYDSDKLLLQACEIECICVLTIRMWYHACHECRGRSRHDGNGAPWHETGKCCPALGKSACAEAGRQLPRTQQLRETQNSIFRDVQVGVTHWTWRLRQQLSDSMGNQLVAAAAAVVHWVQSAP